MYAEYAGYYAQHLNLEADAPLKQLVIELARLDTGAVITLGNVFFETGKADLLSASQHELLRLRDMLGVHPDMRLEISGHTDATGPEHLKRSLSQARADTVRRFLITQGVDEGRLSARGYGDTLPVADNRTEAGRALNRRVAFRILSK